MKGFEVFYEYGPHQGESVYVIASDHAAARDLVKNMILEDYGDYLWSRIGYRNMTIHDCDLIPANKLVIF